MGLGCEEKRDKGEKKEKRCNRPMVAKSLKEMASEQRERESERERVRV